jgi:predicted PurR-regulated permease PerM
VVDWLADYRATRPVALGAILLALVLAILGLVGRVVPALVGQVAALAAGAPAFQARLADALADYPLLAGQAEALRQHLPSTP